MGFAVASYFSDRILVSGQSDFHLRIPLNLNNTPLPLPLLLVDFLCYRREFVATKNNALGFAVHHFSVLPGANEGLLTCPYCLPAQFAHLSLRLVLASP